MRFALLLFRCVPEDHSRVLRSILIISSRKTYILKLLTLLFYPSPVPLPKWKGETLRTAAGVNSTPAA